jgi:DNA modification methylase
MSVEFLHKEGLEYLSSLPDESVDLVLTDPPYITSRDSGMDKWVDHVAERDSSGTDDKTEAEWEAYSSGMNWDQFAKNGSKPLKIDTLKDNYLKYGSIYGKKYAVRTNYGDWDSEFTMSDLQLFINHFYRVLKPGGTCIVFFDLWKITPLKEQLESAKFKQIRFLEWIKTNPQPINSKVNYLTNCREIALLGIKKSKPTFNGSYDNAIYKFPIQGGKDRFHPTQKNTKLFEELIEKHSNKGGVVLDPFLGSGTTAIAAINTGRNFLGCEMELEYYEKAKSRISNALSE